MKKIGFVSSVLLLGWLVASNLTLQAEPCVDITYEDCTSDDCDMLECRPGTEEDPGIACPGGLIGSGSTISHPDAGWTYEENDITYEVEVTQCWSGVSCDCCFDVEANAGTCYQNWWGAWDSHHNALGGAACVVDDPEE